MSTHHVRLLPVVDEHAKLIGVVSRRDLLALFLRPDEDIAADVRQVLDEILLHVSRGVRWDSDHVVTLTDDLPYGLMASIYTADAGTGLRYADSVRAAWVNVNVLPFFSMRSPIQVSFNRHMTR